MEDLPEIKSTDSQQSPQVQDPPPVQKSSQPTATVIFAIVLILILAGLGYAAFGIYTSRYSATESPPDTLSGLSPTPSLSITPTTIHPDLSKQSTPSKAPAEWLVYRHEPFTNAPGRERYGWIGFTLYYPPSWHITRSERDESDGHLFLTLSKDDGSEVDIIQGFSEGGRCLYPEDSEYHTYQGWGFHFVSYIQIKKADSEYWRLSRYPDTNTGETHVLCASDNGEPGTYLSAASIIGVSKVALADETAEREFVEILERVELIYPTY